MDRPTQQGSAIPRRLIVGISGASGVVYGLRILQELQNVSIETHAVISRAARLTINYEMDMIVSEFEQHASFIYRPEDIGAAIASGSFQTMGMIVAPCSMRTLAEIALGLSSSLLTRAADVVLKERRRLVLSPRESPLTLQHLENMSSVTRMGGIICPPVPAFYNRPDSLSDAIDHIVGRMLDLFEIDSPLVKRWSGEPPADLQPT